MRVYVDIDGTLLDGWLDAMFKQMGHDISWYNAQWVDNLTINTDLVTKLEEHVANGDELIMWTNRGPLQMAMTKANLGEYVWNMFDEHQFHDGKKFGTNVAGFTYDNEEKYIIEDGELVQFTTKGEETMCTEMISINFNGIWMDVALDSIESFLEASDVTLSANA